MYVEAELTSVSAALPPPSQGGGESRDPPHVPAWWMCKLANRLAK